METQLTMKYSTDEIQQARTALLGWLKPGDTVYTILRNCSRTGSRRTIGLVIFRDGQPLHPNASVSTVLGLKWADRGDGVITNGGGMDMGFELVYNLGRALWPTGVCQGAKTRKRPAHAPHSNNGPACECRDAGYALKHQWL